MTRMRHRATATAANATVVIATSLVEEWTTLLDIATSMGTSQIISGAAVFLALGELMFLLSQAKVTIAPP